MHKSSLIALFIVLSSCHVWAQPLSFSDGIDAYIEGDTARAHAAFESVISRNPFNGLAFFYLAETNRAQGNCHTALDQYDQALALGMNAGRNGMRTGHIQKARCLAVLGEYERSLDTVWLAWRDWGFDNWQSLEEQADFGAVVDLDRYREMAGLIDAPDRDSRWRADIAYFARVQTETHPDPFHATDHASWDREVQVLSGNVPNLEDSEIVLGLMRLAALIGDGHTVVYPPIEGDLAWSLLPLRPEHLKDGWYITSVAPPFERLIGARIVGAGDHGIAQLIERARAHLPEDNEFTSEWLAGLALQLFEFYQSIGAADDDGRVHLHLEMPNGQNIVQLVEGLPIDRDPNEIAPPEGWARMINEDATLPFWQQDLNQPHFLEALDQNVFYVRLNAITDSEDQTLGGFGAEVAGHLQGSADATLILDLRNNNGGDANLARPFVRELLSVDALANEGHLIVLIGPRSFSATTYLIGALEQYLEPIFVGRPTGGRPAFYSTERSYTLPYSRLRGSVSARQHIDGFSADDMRPAFFPDYVVWVRSTDMWNGHDPLLETAISIASD